MSRRTATAAMLAVLALFLGAWTARADSVPTITGVSPSPLLGPTTPTVFFDGTVVITGENFLGGFLTTDGPLALLGGQFGATVNGAGTVISQPYAIGCCAPFEGQTFHFFVNTPGGSASVLDSITLIPPTPTPEPGTSLLLGTAALTLVGFLRRQLTR